MRSKNSKLKVSPIQSAVVLCIALTSSAFAQQTPNEIIVTAEPPLLISGFDDVRQLQLPMSVGTINQKTLQDIGAQRISDALHLDASVSDNYNLPAYWDKLSVRGYALDNRYNYRRAGLPISAETIIPMENKERIELLKGTSGIQSGTSAPGGLVNFVLKRPPANPEKNIRDVTLSYGPGDNQLIAADLGGRFGEDAAFGYRFNVAHEDLNPYIRETQGHRDLTALAMDWRINASNRLEWEFEQSHHEQIGVNLYSLLGAGPNALPAPVDGTRNITRQSFSQPGVFDGLTSTVRLKHKLDNGWAWNTHYGTQHLRADDRLVYASGCATAPKDRFCSNGDFQIHDYRSDNERRNGEVAQTELRGQSDIAGLTHNLKFSLMRQRQINRMPQTHTDNLAGTTNSITGGFNPSALPSNPPQFNTNIADYNTELALHDHVLVTNKTTVWLGLRHSQLSRQSIQTDGTAEVKDARGVSTPWAALSYQIDHRYTVYGSYGYGLEVEAAPNLSNYANAGQPLPALRSTQREVGIKSQYERTYWQATWFDISRPAVTDAGSACGYNSGPNTCTRQVDGQNRHQGLELSSQSRLRQWDLGASVMWLDAKRENATVDPSLNGQRPINVPKYILRANTEYRFANISGLRSGLRLSHEGERNVTENGDIMLPAWTTLDAIAHYDTKVNNVQSKWTLGINNLANKHYWRESPRQYGQYFLYPGAPRTLRATVVFHL
jgi:iron complex outermembrane receptor protein